MCCEVRVKLLSCVWIFSCVNTSTVCWRDCSFSVEWSWQPCQKPSGRPHTRLGIHPGVAPQPYGSSIFSFLRRVQTVLSGSCANLHSRQQCRGIPCSRIFTSINSLCCLMMAILTGVRWYLIVALTCIYLIVIWAFFHVPVDPLSYLENCLLFFQLGICFFAIESYECLCILDSNPLSVISFTNISSPQ